MLEVKIWTKTYHHTFLPLNKSFTTSLETKDGLLCFINYNYKVSFSLNCQRKNKNVVYYEEHSPRINATIKTDRVLDSHYLCQMNHHQHELQNNKLSQRFHQTFQNHHLYYMLPHNDQLQCHYQHLQE